MKIKKEKILESHLRLYRYFKSKVDDFEIKESEELKAYRKNLEKFERRPFDSSNSSQLERAIDKANLIYIGDFHSLDQGSRNVFRLITQAIKKHKIVLALEMIESRYQGCIDAFLKKQITENEFLEEINYQSSWRFPWVYYRQLFDLARKNKIKVIGLNKSGKLAERDKHASKLLSEKIFHSNGKEKFFIFYGEYHLAPNKIPILLQNKLKDWASPYTSLVIYQNLDHAYWRAQKSKKPSDVIKFNDQEYALLVVPPWLKYESMLHWLQNHEDDPDYEIHQYALQSSIKFYNDDINDHFLRFSAELNAALKLKIKTKDLEDFNILDGENLELLFRKCGEQKDQIAKKINLRILQTAKSAKLLGLNYYFCPSYSFNRLSYLVGLHLYVKKFPVKVSIEKMSREELFNFLCNAQMFAYFCSKIFNPYRKCNLYLNFKAMKERNRTEKFVNSCTLDILEKRKYPLNFFQARSDVGAMFSVSRNLGHYLGEMLFDQNKGLRFGLNDILNPPEKSSLLLIKKMIRKNEMKTHQKRML
jgi:hypothetical protein